MKITIHRGTNQIGGCVTEIESNGYKVFIDFGEQLPGVEFKELFIGHNIILFQDGHVFDCDCSKNI